MKARLLIFLALNFVLYNLGFSQCESVPASYTCIPDSEFEEELVLNGMDTDGVVNGQVLTTDISDEVTLVMFAKGITDLTGIEDFDALEILNVSSNALGNLDLSANDNLIEIYANSCQLTSLILPSTPTLLQVHCVNNFLTDLDVTGIPNVQWLEIPRQTGSGFGTLNLQNNTMLATLDCYDAGLNSLDISNNTALSALRLEENNLSTLNLSNNTALQIIDIDFNPLTELDVSTTTQLWSFSATWCNFQNINLKNGHNDLITSLDVRNNGFSPLCIQVDEVPPVNVAGWNKDASTEYMVNCPGLSAEENQIRLIKIYPNPTQNNISIDNLNSETNYSILNVNGKIIKSGSFDSNNHEISLENISNGIYFLKLFNPTSQTIKKVVKL